MLQLLDESIEAFLRAEVPLAPGEVAIAFDPPDRQWAAGISQPTVNIFLWGVNRDRDAARAGMETFDRGGQTVRRRPLPRIQVRYLLTAWTSDRRDEHQLLGEVMRAVLAKAELAPPYLRSPLDDVVPYPSLRLAQTDDSAQNDFWKAIDGQLKPGLELLITMPVDTGLAREVAPPPSEVEVAASDARQPGSRVFRRQRTIGAASSEITELATQRSEPE